MADEGERPGLDQADERWRVSWLEPLLEVPADAVWPRLMTVPHPAAVGSLGREFVRYAEARSGKRLRWWQRLAATRLLEVDADERLVWEAMVLSTARQVGKSWLLRELALWRMHQGRRFGEPQDIVHTGKDLPVCQEIQLPARSWAKAQPGLYKVRAVNGQEQIEYLPDGSRWMIRAKDAAYGLTVGVAVVDEAWKVPPRTLNESIVPTMVEREQPQLWLFSTAHRLATPLMLGYRQVGLGALESGDGDLLIEWSAPADAALDDVAVWRLASPHWTGQREKLIRRQLEMVTSGELVDPEEPDPVESFRAQWLNQWPKKRTDVPGKVEALLPPGLWADLTDDLEPTDAPVFVAMEDDFGYGAAVAAVCRRDDGRLEVDGWLRDDWDSAVRDVERLGRLRNVRELQVGASLLDRMPAGGNGLPRARPSAGVQTRAGLALLRDLAASGQVVHDGNTGELDQAITLAQVTERTTGLQLVVRAGSTHLVKAAVWALAAAHRPAPAPMIR